MNIEKEIGLIRTEYQKALDSRGALAKQRFDYLESEIDNIIDDIIDGETVRKLAAKYDVTLSVFMSWRFSSKHSESITIAFKASSESHISKAEDALYKVQESDSMAQVNAAKNIADHHRFVAGQRDRVNWGIQKDIKISDGTERKAMSSEQALEQQRKIDEYIAKKLNEGRNDKIEEAEEVKDED